MTEQELLDLKQHITESKETLNKLEARKEVLLDELKKKFDVSTLAEAGKKVESMSKDIEKQDTEIQTMVAELEKKLDDANITTSE